jgi:hypothetical protein
VRPNTTYTGSFYAKADTEGVPITASLGQSSNSVIPLGVLDHQAAVRRGSKARCGVQNAP